MKHRLQQTAENLWVLHFPMKLLGTSVGRRTTVIRLDNGDVVVHSTAPFESEDVEAIRELGPVAFLLDATGFHDTFSAAGAAAFPEARYFAPPHFGRKVHLDRPIESLESPPARWDPDLKIALIGGMPAVNEYALLHQPSRTLVVADLVFHLGPPVDRWTKFFFRYIAGSYGRVRTSRMFRSMIRNREEFERSMEQILSWDFDRLIMGHGHMVESQGHEHLRKAFDEICAQD